MSLCQHCVSGVRHEGTPEGKFEQIGDVKSYVATPSIDYPKDKVLLYLPDVFGFQLINHKLLADDYARNGFKVIIPDLFGDDACPADALDAGSNYDFGAWVSRHYPSSKTPLVRQVLQGLKDAGVTKVGVLGFCYGARIAFNFAFENAVHVVVVSHPSFLKAPEDLEKYKAESKAPLLINSCEVDSQFPKEAQAVADKVLGGGQFTPGYERTYWAGCVHGFSVRGDLSDPKVKAGKEGAFKASVEFLIKYL